MLKLYALKFTVVSCGFPATARLSWCILYYLGNFSFGEYVHNCNFKELIYYVLSTVIITSCGV